MRAPPQMTSASISSLSCFECSNRRIAACKYDWILDWTKILTCHGCLCISVFCPPTILLVLVRGPFHLLTSTLNLGGFPLTFDFSAIYWYSLVLFLSSFVLFTRFALEHNFVPWRTLSPFETVQDSSFLRDLALQGNFFFFVFCFLSLFELDKVLLLATRFLCNAPGWLAFVCVSNFPSNRQQEIKLKVI